METKTIELAHGVDLGMVYISSGSFVMGSPEDESDRWSDEGPPHKVTLKGFWMSKYPITQAQWRAVACSPQVERELDPDPSRFKGDKHPVEQVNWHQAIEFCARLSASTGQPYTLPSEAQWEYACRAGTTTPFHFGETITPALTHYDSEETADVGSFPPNAWGLHDMHGNVWEWCHDHYHENYNGAPADGSAWVTEGNGNHRVLRGGSWFSFPSYCRSACRLNFNPDFHTDSFGFRVVSVPHH